MSRTSYYAAILWALALGACSDQEQPTTTSSPELKVTTSAIPAAVACNFDSVKSLANTYFSPPAKQQAATFVTAMGSTAYQPPAVNNGFQILNLLGSVSRSSTPGVSTVGQRLARATIKCMYNADDSVYRALAGGQGINGVRFDLALSKATGGVFFVVGKDLVAGAGKDFAAPTVLKGIVNGVAVSKVAPGPTSGTFPDVTFGSWAGILSNGTALVYGYQVTANPLVFEWATIDPSINFDPYALVSMCTGNTDDLMVQESGVGVLSFDKANLCDLPDDATGRTATGFKSQFNNKSVQSLNVRFDPANSPPATWPVKSAPSIVVFVSVPDVGNKSVGVLGVCVYLTGAANNGTPTNITSSTVSHDIDCQDPPTGPSTTNPPYLSVKTTMTPGADHSVADFGHVTISKTGGLVLTATADVIDRSGAGGTFKKINVKP